MLSPVIGKSLWISLWKFLDLRGFGENAVNRLEMVTKRFIFS